MKGVLYTISKGETVTGCIMNCAFRKEVIPAMYQLLMGQDAHGNKWPYDRWGDIWSGYIAKKYVEEVLKGAVAINYAAHVKHQRASNVYTNLSKELSGYAINEEFAEFLVPLKFDSYEEIANVCGVLSLFGDEHSDKYEEAMKIWGGLTK
jgi:hypothetical protein